MLALRHAIRRLGKASKRFQRRTAAAVKLQAAFRAHKARKVAQQLREERDCELLVSPYGAGSCEDLQAEGKYHH